MYAFAENVLASKAQAKQHSQVSERTSDLESEFPTPSVSPVESVDLISMDDLPGTVSFITFRFVLVFDLLFRFFQLVEVEETPVVQSSDWSIPPGFEAEAVGRPEVVEVAAEPEVADSVNSDSVDDFEISEEPMVVEAAVEAQAAVATEENSVPVEEGTVNFFDFSNLLLCFVHV